MDEKPPSVEISTGLNNPVQSNIVHPSENSAPQPVLVTPTQQAQFIQGNMQAVAPGMVQPMAYIPLKYNPKPNYRTISYIVLGVGIVVSILASAASSGTTSNILEAFSSMVCCGAFTSVVFLDAAFYSGKAKWQQVNGLPSGGSTTSFVIEMILGVILAIMFMFTALAFVLEFA